MKLNNIIAKTSRVPYIIAEIGVNHEGSLDQAKRLIELAKEGGADAAKFQTYKAGSLASKKSPAYWDLEKEPTESQHALFKKYDSFDEGDYIVLAEHCEKCEIHFLSTPFDKQSLEFLNPLLSYFKIASADLTNIPFLREVAKKGKPIILSTGASTLAEIDIAVDTIVKFGCEEIGLLHCILNYPTDNINANLEMIKGIKKVYPQYTIGYSDHTMPDESMTSLITAQLLGAVIIEKHFTHDKTLKGNDHYHAMDVKDLRCYVQMSERINELLGDANYKRPIKTENISRENARRSIVIDRDVKVGTELNVANITYKRPGTGISPLHWDEVIGKRVTRDLEEDHILMWSDLES